MWKEFDLVKVMVYLFENPGEMVQVRRKNGKILYRVKGETEFNTEDFLKGNTAVFVAHGVAHARGVEIVYHKGELYHRLLAGTREVPEVVDIREMEMGGKLWRVPICIIDGVLYPDANSLTLREFGEINPLLVKQTLQQFQGLKVTLGYPGVCKKFRIRDFEMMGPHYTINGNKSGYSFLHSKLGFLSGLGELRKVFPDESPAAIRSIYNHFGINPSTNIIKMWGPEGRDKILAGFVKKHGLYYDEKTTGVEHPRDGAVDSEWILENIDVANEKEAEMLWDWVKENRIPKPSGRSTSRTSSRKTRKPS